MKLSEYLLECKEKLGNISNYKDIHIVIGNESCDLDSTVCTVSLAYYLRLNTYKNGDVFVAPVLNLNSKLFRTRVLVKFVLQNNELNPNNLIFKNQIDLKNFPSDCNVKISLVDHHVLTDELSFLKSDVVEIFDHRPIDTSVVYESEVRIRIEQVASCATLIAEYILEKIEDYETVASILYSAIVFDAIGFKPSAKKATPLDNKIATQIEETLEIPELRMDCFNALWKAHNDISNLSALDILYKDLKCIEKIVLPGVPMLVADYLKLPGACKAVEDFCREMKAKFCIIMGLMADQQNIKRDLALYSVDEGSSLMHLFVEKLVGDSRIGLESQETECPKICYYLQNNVSYSRKQFIPIIKECVEKHKL